VANAATGNENSPLWPSLWDTTVSTSPGAYRRTHCYHTPVTYIYIYHHSGRVGTRARARDSRVIYLIPTAICRETLERFIERIERAGVVDRTVGQQGTSASSQQTAELINIDS
jgi:hypothetical protein